MWGGQWCVTELVKQVKIPFSIVPIKESKKLQYGEHILFGVKG